MAELPTVEIVSLKNPAEKWIINADDFDPTKHTLWEQRQDTKPAAEAESTPPPADAGAGARKR
jgi:hypothetical protein